MLINATVTLPTLPPKQPLNPPLLITAGPGDGRPPGCQHSPSPARSHDNTPGTWLSANHLQWLPLNLYSKYHQAPTGPGRSDLPVSPFLAPRQSGCHHVALGPHPDVPSFTRSHTLPPRDGPTTLLSTLDLALSYSSLRSAAMSSGSKP